MVTQRFDTTIHGSFTSGGPETDTKVDIKLENTMYPTGDTKTIVDDAEIICPHEFTWESSQSENCLLTFSQQVIQYPLSFIRLLGRKLYF